MERRGQHWHGHRSLENGEGTEEGTAARQWPLERRRRGPDRSLLKGDQPKRRSRGGGLRLLRFPPDLLGLILCVFCKGVDIPDCRDNLRLCPAGRNFAPFD